MVEARRLEDSSMAEAREEKAHPWRKHGEEKAHPQPKHEGDSPESVAVLRAPVVPNGDQSVAKRPVI